MGGGGGQVEVVVGVVVGLSYSKEGRSEASRVIVNDFELCVGVGCWYLGHTFKILNSASGPT